MDLHKVDDLIKSDLTNFIDGIATREVEVLKTDFRLWLLAFGCASDNKLTLIEQKVFKRHFDKETVSKLITYMSSMQTNDVLDELKTKCEESYENLYILAKSDITSEVKKVLSWFDEIPDSKTKIKFLNKQLTFISDFFYSQR